jgi:hypothetical protein
MRVTGLSLICRNYETTYAENSNIRHCYDKIVSKQVYYCRDPLSKFRHKKPALDAVRIGVSWYQRKWPTGRSGIRLW